MMAFVTTNKSLMLKIKQQRAIRRLISFKKVPPGQNPCRSSTSYSASTGACVLQGSGQTRHSITVLFARRETVQPVAVHIASTVVESSATVRAET